MTTAANKCLSDRGAVLVIVAAWMTSAIALVTFVVDIGHWFEHKRHLQLQVDAAALGGGGKFAGCFNNGGGNAEIFKEATKYAGAVGTWQGTAYSTSPRYNNQIPNAGSVSVLYQSPTYPDGTNPNDGTETEGPCQTAHYMFDVKATESNVSLFLIGGKFVPAINAHARVQLRALSDTHPSLPLAVPDIKPKQVAVTFVNETASPAGTELTGCTGLNMIPGTTCTFSLTKESTPSGGLNMWSGPANVTLPAAPAKIGVRVGIGTNVQSCANVIPQDGSSSYSCYDGSSTTTGLTMIRDYAVASPATPVPPSNLTAPVLEGVWPTSCSGNGAFYFIGAGTCASGVTAEVNYGTGSTQPNSQYYIRATAGGTTANLTPTSYDSSRDAWIWTTNQASPPFALGPEAGAQPISLSWEVQDTSKIFGGSACTDKNNNPCKGNFGAQQRFYGGIDDSTGSGPIRSMQMTGSDDVNGPASLVPGTYALSLRIGLAGNYQVYTPCAPPPSGASYNCPGDPTVLLRLKSRNGSTTYTIDCGTPAGGGADLYLQITKGCQNRFSINTAGVCPDVGTPPTPPDCAPLNNVGNGLKAGQVKNAMNDRFAPGGSCFTNSYPTIVPGDPRVVILMLTDFSAFNGNGANQSVPVITYGAFYVTGWDQADSDCNGKNEPSPPGAGRTGDIWGHFITYVDPSASGGPGACDPSGLLPCVPVLTQ
jgi:hypothetical protein